ncbi:MAG: hypothetical protein V7K90_10635 [Nostoc sp.]|uniref:hypothetical protein n=1 Tax=Nostoc sp. TaxID=1180 RepID=UPI002FFC3071
MDLCPEASDRPSLRLKKRGYLTPHQDQISAFMKVYEIKLDCNPEYNKNDFIESFWLFPDDLIEWLYGGEPAKSDLLKLVQIFYQE